MDKNMEKYKLSKKDVMSFCHKNQYATMMFYNAGDDYIASRCCLLNGLLQPGLGLACQSIEKILKSFIYLEAATKTKLKGNNKHNPFKLKEELKKIKNYKLDKFDDLLKNLFDYYQERYYDNKTSVNGMSNSELDKIDELWVYLVENLPMPDEVKYRLKFFGDLFEEGTRKYYLNYHWATISNKALTSNYSKWNNLYKKVVKHLYPNKNKIDD